MAHVGAWPSYLPSPTHISSPAIIDPILEMRADAGHSIRRSRYTRSWRRYRLEWIGITTQAKNYLQDHVERVLRGRANTFSWVHPYAQTITNILLGTPVHVQTVLGWHGVQTNDTVVIANVLGTPINGTWTVTWQSAGQVSLNGSSTTTGWIGGGTMALQLDNVMLDLADDMWPSPERLIGRDQDNLGVYNLALNFLEVP
jgi:hypothetical protein